MFPVLPKSPSKNPSESPAAPPPWRERCSSTAPSAERCPRKIFGQAAFFWGVNVSLDWGKKWGIPEKNWEFWGVFQKMEKNMCIASSACSRMELHGIAPVHCMYVHLWQVKYPRHDEMQTLMVTSAGISPFQAQPASTKMRP